MRAIHDSNTFRQQQTQTQGGRDAKKQHQTQAWRPAATSTFGVEVMTYSVPSSAASLCAVHSLEQTAALAVADVEQMGAEVVGCSRFDSLHQLRTAFSRLTVRTVTA